MVVWARVETPPSKQTVCVCYTLPCHVLCVTHMPSGGTKPVEFECVGGGGGGVRSEALAFCSVLSCPALCAVIVSLMSTGPTHYPQRGQPITLNGANLLPSTGPTYITLNGVNLYYPQRCQPILPSTVPTYYQGEYKITVPQMMVLTHSGLRGAVALILALVVDGGSARDAFPRRCRINIYFPAATSCGRFCQLSSPWPEAAPLCSCVPLMQFLLTVEFIWGKPSSIDTIEHDATVFCKWY